MHMELSREADTNLAQKNHQFTQLVQVKDRKPYN